MTTTAVQVNPNGIRVFMGTITGAANIHEALADFARQHHIQTAAFEMLGGLHEVELTAYDFEKQERQRPLKFQKPCEIIAGQGTISLLAGQPHIHIHMTLAFRDDKMAHGIAVIGGHVSQAAAFAVEFTLTAYEGRPIHRALHPGTGLQLWDCPELPEKRSYG